MRFITTTAVASLALSASTLAQTTWTIPSAETPTLQFALESPSSPVQAGDTIQLTEAGFYLSTFTITTPDLIIEAAPDNDITIDALGLGSVFTAGPFQGTLTLRNLTITGGLAPDGGAIKVITDIFTRVNIEDCIIEGNIATDDGGAIQGTDTNLRIFNTTFRNNQTNGSTADGTSNGGAIQTVRGTIHITDSLFEDNTSHDEGGAVRCFDSTFVSVSGTTFLRNNTLNGEGGALMVTSNNAVVAIDDCRFQENETAGSLGASSGGAAYFEDLISLEITDTTFLRNKATGSLNDNNQGGAIAFVNLRGGSIENTLFQHNTARGNGGALFINTSPVTSDRVRFLGNRSLEGLGGAVSIFGETDDEAHMRSCLFVGNTAFSGSAVYASSGPDNVVLNSTAVMNTTTSPTGGVFTIAFGTSEMSIVNSISRNNTPSSLLNGLDGSFPGESQMYSSNIEGLAGSRFEDFRARNIDADPLFIRMPNDGGDGFGDDPATPAVDESFNDKFGVLRITEGSPSIDASDTREIFSFATPGAIETDPKDLLGNNRVQTINGTEGDTGTPVLGHIADHGAYEIQLPDTTLDFDMSGFLDSFDVIEFLDLFDTATSP